MADVLLFKNANEGISQLLSEIERPIHQAVCLGKVLCPHNECVAKRDFFFKNGIAHHYRIRHKQEFTVCQRSESLRLRMELHEQETKDCLERIFEYCRTDVSAMNL